MRKFVSFTIPAKMPMVLFPGILSLKRMAAHPWVQGAVIGFICVCSFFIHLGAHDVDLMEARNFITVREMVTDGHWLVPTMNGEFRITKPPVPTWITAAASMAAGKSEDPFFLRLPAALMASLMVWALWGLTRKISSDGWLPVISAMIFATCPLVIDMGRRGSWDIYCHSFMMLGIWALLSGMNKKESAYGTFILAGSLVSFSFMSKGPVAFYALLLPLSAGYTAVYGLDIIRQNVNGLLLAGLVFLILSSVWPVMVFLRHPDLFTHVVLQETSAWTSRHVKPFYFYGHFAAYTGIWMVFVIAGFISPYAKKIMGSFENYRFVLIWLVLSLLLLSILPEKKERYLLPAIAPMSMLAGIMWRGLMQAHRQRCSTTWDTRWLRIHTTLVFVSSLIMPVIIFTFGVGPGRLSTVSAIGWSVAFLLTSMVLLISGINKSVFNIFIVSLGLICLINLSVLPVFYQSLLYKKHPDNHPLQSIRHIEPLHDLKLYSIGDLNMKLIWDVGRMVRPWYFKTESLPIENQPIAIISTMDPRPKILSKYRHEIDVTLLYKCPYPSKKPHAAYYITLLTLKQIS